MRSPPAGSWAAATRWAGWSQSTCRPAAAGSTPSPCSASPAPGCRAALTEREASFAGDAPGAAAALVDLVRERFGRPASEGATGTSPFLLAVDVPDEARAAIATAAGTQLNLCGLWSMIPGASDDQLAAVDVPTFLGVGEHDITGEPRLIPGHLTGCRDLTLYVCPTCGHNHNVAPTRTLLWDRLVRWLDGSA